MIGKIEQALRFLLPAFFLLIPLSIAASETVFYISLPLWICLLVLRKDNRLIRNPYIWPVLSFAVIALLASLWGIRPAVSLHKCHKLLLLAIIFMVYTEFEGLTGITRPVIAFIAGTSLLGIVDAVRVPFQVSRGTALFDTGNMTDPQFYMVALCLLVAIAVSGSELIKRPLLITAMLLNIFGILIHFKRGVWFSFVAAMVIMTLLSKRWRILAAVLLCAFAILLMPQTRDRLSTLVREWDTVYGGRAVLWSKVAPQMLKEYPQGIGLGAATRDDFMQYAEYVQPRLNHLHNNILQVTLELGWAGLLAWLYWMVMALMVFWRILRSGPVGRFHGIALGAFCAFCALLINGMVEYNFGDSEVLMMTCFLMGISTVLSVEAQKTPVPI